MAENTVSKSFRIPQIDAVWLQDLAKSTGNTQTEILSKALTYARLNEGKEIAVQSMSNGGITEDAETLDLLKGLGISTVSGFAGYYISGYIRKQLELDEDKGTQVLIGLLVGLGTLVMQGIANNSKKK
jgi:hypothetical protein